MKLIAAKDLQIEFKYKKTHTVEKRKGTSVNLRHLEDNQSVIYGDGETFHYLLTEL